jgi:hypothetical protein
MGTAHLAKRFDLLPFEGLDRGWILVSLPLSLVWAVGSAVPASAFDTSRIVRLPGGTAINLGPHALLVEQALERGSLTALADGYLYQGQAEDAAAVLVYAVRYRPGRTPEIAQTAVRLAEKYQNPAWTGLVFRALAAEPAMLPETLAEALEQADLSPFVAETAYASAGLPPAADSKAAGSDAAVQESDVAAETSSPNPNALSAGEVFGGSLLPESLRIGGGNGGGNGGLNSAEPSDDGGAS